MKAITHSPVSSHINIAFIERNNLTIRERNRRLTRKTLWFLQKEEAPYLFIKDLFTIRPNVPYIKISSHTNSSLGGTDGTSR
jgi:hypothetical protein